ncbi:MAG: aspartate/glutamate racemase family protein [Candidatus Latescibacteria bacterium]|jgi:aspartate racemase|nr:aspartate/glutamate racemase family protein [Candidatus Latescibacterota bacterium]
MKTIGLIGGMSWESSVTYYRLINEGVKARLGGLHSAQLCLFSVDFEEIERLQHEGEWDRAAVIVTDAAKRVEAAGADFLLLCTNTMHKVAGQIEAGISIPLLHIVDATAKRIQGQGLSKVGLLGTKFTMEDAFYKGRLCEQHGIDVLIPDADARDFVHKVIYDELCLGKIEEDSRKEFVQIIEKLGEEGAEAVILGCTEIALLVGREHTPVLLFDTTEIHAEEAVEMALVD